MSVDEITYQKQINITYPDDKKKLDAVDATNEVLDLCERKLRFTNYVMLLLLFKMENERIEYLIE